MLALQCHGALCYDFSELDELMSEEEVRKDLEVSPKANWQECSSEVYSNLAQDWLLECDSFIVPLLENRIPVLIYSGNKDFICNSFGARAWTHALKVIYTTIVITYVFLIVVCSLVVGLRRIQQPERG